MLEPQSQCNGASGQVPGVRSKSTPRAQRFQIEPFVRTDTTPRPKRFAVLWDRVLAYKSWAEQMTFKAEKGGFSHRHTLGKSDGEYSGRWFGVCGVE